ncbi:MAG: hypothetical protein HYZ39_02505 [Mycolicibacterium cosmeticum]|nr:hypothetical protein [Mycolicibacterium cosmeticum]
MTSSFARSAVVASGLLTAVCAATFGGGIAAAVDPLVGRTYADATSDITSKWKAQPVLASVVGDGRPLEKCIVSSWRRETKTGKIYLSLYCDDTFASSTKSGQSAGSAEGRAAKKHAADVEWLQTHPELCVKYKIQYPELFKEKPMEGCEGAV